MDRQRANVGMNRHWNTWTPVLDASPSNGQESCIVTREEYLLTLIMDRQIDRHTYRHTDRHTQTDTHRQTHTQTHRQTHRTDIHCTFNQKKSASLYFISKMLKGAHLPNVYLNGVLVKQVPWATF